jgi:DedD protein
MPLPPPPPQSRFSLSRLFGAAPAGAAQDAALGSDATVEALRTQARRRLIGVVVLLAIGVVSFPLVFETEPRPMGVDTPMQRLPGGSGSAGRVTEAAPASLATAPPLASARPAAEGVAVPAPPTPPDGVPIGAPVRAPDTAPDTAPATLAAPAPAPAPALAAVAPPAAPVPTRAAAPPPAAKVDAKAAVKADTRADTPADTPASGQSEGQRARALLEGRSPPAAERARPVEPVVAARFVVQVGAYTEPRTLRDVRGRVEALGLKTYTQVVDSPAGPRTRVRVGPFDSRAEAEAASAKLRAAGLPGAILAL